MKTREANHNNYSSVSVIALKIILIILMAIFMVPLYYRTELDLPAGLFATFGLVSISFLGSLFFTFFIAFINFGTNNPVSFRNKLIYSFYLAFPASCSVFAIYTLGVILDPWLRISTFNKMLPTIAMVYIIIGGLFYLLIRRRKPSPELTELAQEPGSFGVLKRRSFSVILLALLFILGVILRSMNLDGYPPHVDEFSHFMRALNWLKGDPPLGTRAFVTVTLPVTMAFQLFGVSVAAARMVMAVLSMAAIFPLYSLMRRFGEATAFIAVSLFVLSPSGIAMSQIVRDYSVTAFFVYSTYFLSLRVIETEIGAKLRTWFRKNWLDLLLLGMIGGYSFYDQASISAVVIGNLLVFALIVVIKIFFEYKGSRIKNIVLIGILIVAGITVTFAANKLHFDALHPTALYFKIMTSGSMQNWSNLFPQVGWLLLAYSLYILVTNSITIKDVRSQQVVTLTLTFLGLMVFSALFLFAGRLAVRDRYFVVFVYYLIPIAAMFFTKIGLIFREKFKKYKLIRTTLIVPLFLLFFVNVPALAYTRSYVGGENIITGSPHYIYEDAYQFLKENVQPGDVIITDKIGNYDRLADNYFDPEDVANIKVLETTEDLDKKLSKYGQGWIAISENREPSDSGLAFESAKTEHFDIQFYGSFHGHVNIWRFKNY